MKENKTIFSWLLELPEDLCIKAVRNARKYPLSSHDIYENEAYSLSDAITCAFKWDKTIEGDSYWRNLHEKLERSE